MNVVERVDPFDTIGIDDDKKEIAEKRLQEEIMKSIGQEVINKETLRHIAYYRALSDGAPEKILLKIKQG